MTNENIYMGCEFGTTVILNSMKFTDTSHKKSTLDRRFKNLFLDIGN